MNEPPVSRSGSDVLDAEIRVAVRVQRKNTSAARSDEEVVLSDPVAGGCCPATQRPSAPEHPPTSTLSPTRPEVRRKRRAIPASRHGAGQAELRLRTCQPRASLLLAATRQRREAAVRRASTTRRDHAPLPDAGGNKGRGWPCCCQAVGR